MTAPTCPRCGHTHPRCTAHNRSGTPCGQNPEPGMTVCRHHGGKAPQAIKARDTRQQEHQARTEAARFAARSDIHPADALLELVHYQAGIVNYWRHRIEDIDDEDLEWGVTREKTGGDDYGTTSEATPHIAYRLLTEAQDKLAAYASAALKAGIDERRVRLAESQGALVAQVIRGILDQLHLTPEQLELVPTVVPAQLRLLTSSDGNAA